MGVTLRNSGFSPRKFVFCGALVVLPRRGEGLGPLRMIHRIGVELGLQRHAGALAVKDSILALILQVVAGIELDAGAIRMNRHGSAGNRIMENSTGIAPDLKIMIVTALQVQRLVVCVNVFSNGLGSTEVHRCPSYAAQFPGGDALGIVGIEKTGRQGQHLDRKSVV